jgi:RND family efflux transporter MFP subunit
MSNAFRDKVQPGEIAPPARTLGDRPTDQVHKVLQVERVQIVGAVRAQRRTEIGARVMATIVEMSVKAGDMVRRDDVLVRLDDRDLRARVAEARQAVNAAEIQARNAEKDYKRFEDLLKQKAISDKEFDDAKARYQTAEAQLSQAREALNAAETALSFTVILAPADGKVVDKFMDAGDTTQPGRPLLAIYDPGHLRLEAAVPETLVLELKVGDQLEMSIDTLPETQAKPLVGAIEEIVPQADSASRSVLVKVRVPEGARVIEGAFGRLHIPSRERVRLCVASSAVREVGQLSFVDVVRPDKILERRQIKLGESSPFGRVEALSGLNDGETVVLYGPPPQPMPEGVRLFTGGELQ